MHLSNNDESVFFFGQPGSIARRDWLLKDNSLDEIVTKYVVKRVKFYQWFLIKLKVVEIMRKTANCNGKLKA